MEKCGHIHFGFLTSTSQKTFLNYNPIPRLKLSKKQLEKACKEYLAFCELKGRVPLFKELAFKLGISADTLTDYLKRKDYSTHLLRVKQAQEVGLNRKLIDENKPVGAIFLLKAQHGYDDNGRLNLNISGDLGVVMLPRKP